MSEEQKTDATHDPRDDIRALLESAGPIENGKIRTGMRWWRMVIDWDAYDHSRERARRRDPLFWCYMLTWWVFGKTRWWPAIWRKLWSGF